MADVRPFKALRYNQRMVGDLSHIVSPPFDTISPQLQRALYQHSPYNVVRLEAGERLPSDTSTNNRYTRSAALLADWTAKGVLAREVSPAFYLVQHTFRHRDREMSRLELMGCVRLEEYENRVVLPHEYTRPDDKSDRLALMEACHANFSPVMCFYRDEGHGLSTVFQRVMADQPAVDFSDMGGQSYKMWMMGDGEVTREISRVMADKSLYIADGHHRYETALAYRDLKKTPAGDDAANYVMMGLVEFDDPGLMVLPYHRVLGGLDQLTLDLVRERLTEVFNFESFPEGGETPLGRFLEEIEGRGRDDMVMGLLDPAAGPLQLLTLKPGTSLESRGALARSEAWVLEALVLRYILGDSVAQRLDYIHDGDEAMERVRGDEFQMGFFLKPFPLDLFETVMNVGERLPPKSTFFYPKLATGLVINLLVVKL